MGLPPGIRRAGDGLDEIISDTTPGPTAWTNVNNKVVNESNHMKGTLPEGANVMCMDGHVEWRKFSVANSVSQLMASGKPGAYWFPNQ